MDECIKPIQSQVNDILFGREIKIFPKNSVITYFKNSPLDLGEFKVKELIIYCLAFDDRWFD